MEFNFVYSVITAVLVTFIKLETLTSKNLFVCEKKNLCPQELVHSRNVVGLHYMELETGILFD